MAVQAVNDLYPPLYQAARNGVLFSGQTAVTGVAPGTAIGTTAAQALYNPVGSGVNLVVLKSWMQYLSGTLGIGFVSWISHDSPAQAAITGTAIVAPNGFVGVNTAGQGRLFTTATVPASGKIIRPHANLPPMLATTVLTPWSFVDEVDGAIIVAPGAGVSLQATAGAGTSPLVIFGMMWEEVAIAA